MKILYLVSGIGPPAGWGTQFIQELIFKLSKKGVNATIINPIYKHTPTGWKEWTKLQEDKYKVRIISLNAPDLIKKNLIFHFMLTPFFVTWTVFKLLSKEKFDLIHEFSSTPIILLRSLLIKLFFKTQTVFTLSVYNNTLAGKFFWFKLFDFAAAYCIPSTEIINILKRLGIDKNKIYFSPPGINLSLFKTKDRTWARTQLKLPENKFIISFFGSLTFEKGVDEIIEAAKKLDQSKVDNIFIFLASIWKGSNEHEGFIKKIKETNLDYLELREKYINVPLLLSASDVVLFPQRTGFGTTIPPISILEALAANRFVIGTDINGNSKLINGKNGSIIPSGNSDSLKNAIEQVIRKNPLIQTNRLEDFDIKLSIKNHIKLYNKISSS